MIIQALSKYYDLLAADEFAKISKLGYSPAKVSFAVVISGDGNLTNIIDFRIDAKKKVPKMLEVPLQKSRSGKFPPPYFLCDKPEFVLGIEKMKKKDFGSKFSGNEERPTILVDNGKEVIIFSKHSNSYFSAFRDFHHSLLDGIKDPLIQAFLKFLDGWNPEKSLDHPKITEYCNEIFAGGSLIFEISGKYLHENQAAVRAWERYMEREVSEESYIAQCLVSGEEEPIAKTHQKITGVLGAQSAGGSIISFNEDSFCSYGKEQSWNAPISKSAMFKYTTTLKHLLEWGSENRIQIGDATTVFWADTSNKSCIDLARFLIDPVEDSEENEDETKKAERRIDPGTRQLVNDILSKVKYGKYLEKKDLGIDPEKTNFYILGLSPNNARLAVRFWHQDSFGNFITRSAQHHLDMEIERNERWSRYISPFTLLKQTVHQGSKDPAASPLLGGQLMISILDNAPYPVTMFSAILNRVKVERSINYPKAAFIKAFLIRNARTRKTYDKDLITVSLNEKNPNVPYRLGRLFAVMESAQRAANPTVKRTIRDSYFASASSTPRIVYPALLKLHQHHLSKINSEKPGLGVNFSKMMDEVMSPIDQFPNTLSLEEQGMFMLGYYHQHESFFRKNDEKETTEVEMNQ